MNVLFVEDDVGIQQCYQDYAARYGWGARFARSVDEARTALQTPVRHDVVVLDHHILGGLGCSLLQTIRAHQPQARVVATGALGVKESDYPGIPWVDKTKVCRWIHGEVLDVP